MSAGELIEEGHPEADGRAFRRCLGQFATGVTIMTAERGGRPTGMTVNSFSALSLDPPLVLWSIRRASASLPVFAEAEHFAVNVLAGDQVELANLFASADKEKFDSVPWSTGRGGSPLLRGAIATIECAREQILDGGDHLIVVGRVQHFARHSGEPLLFAQGRYALSQEHPAAAQAAPQSQSRCAPDEFSLLRLLHFTSNEMSARFAEQRREAGLTVGVFRIYSWLRSQPRTLPQLQRLAYLGDRDTQDSVAELVERGHAVRDHNGAYALTPAGQLAAAASRQRVQLFEEQVLHELPAGDVETTRRVLSLLVRHASVA